MKRFTTNITWDPIRTQTQIALDALEIHVIECKQLAGEVTSEDNVLLAINGILVATNIRGERKVLERIVDDERIVFVNVKDGRRYRVEVEKRASVQICRKYKGL
jgi:hypothetical protein